jgi:hypothetical protein
MDKAVKILLFALGLFLGYFIFSKDAETITETVTEIKTDTVYITIRDTVRITRNEIKQEFLRDTVLIDFKSQINSFTVSKPFLYGNTTVTGEVIGEVLKMDIVNDFKLPQVTNTITTTNTVIKKPSGLFLTAGIGVTRNFSTPSIGVVYVKNKMLFSLSTRDFKVGYKLGK